MRSRLFSAFPLAVALAVPVQLISTGPPDRSRSSPTAPVFKATPSFLYRTELGVASAADGGRLKYTD